MMANMVPAYKQLLVMLFVGVLVAPEVSMAAEWKFDFGKTTDSAVQGYMHVDNTTAYNPSVGYGIVDNDPNKDAGASNWSSVNLTGNAVTNLNSNLCFRVDVPNGDYYVTVGAGNYGWDEWMKIYVNGVEYDNNSNNSNLYVLDTAPSNSTPKWLEEPYSIHSSSDPNYSAGFVRTWGWNRTWDGLGADAEILYLKQERITVTDGKIVAYGTCASGWGMINFMEVQSVPEPITMTSMLVGLGVLLSKREK